MVSIAGRAYSFWFIMPYSPIDLRMKAERDPY
jgi:hypothetical protein